MNFKDLNIGISYKNVGEETFAKIINPILACAKTYKRSVGFFSSSVLNFISYGITSLVRSGGKIYLATSPKLSEEDIAAIKIGYDAKNIVKERFNDEAIEALKSISDENARLIASLISEGVLDIKIVLKDGGMYHDKLAILEDHDSNIVACVGSNNESQNGYYNNYEKVRIYKSWTDVEGRINDEIDEFESIWNKSNNSLDVYDFMDAFKEKLLERVEHQGDFAGRTNKYSMRPYQEEAKVNWIDNGCKGFFVMATGTGKTITSLNAIGDLILKKHVFTVIAVPYKHLVEQWYDDAKEFFPTADIIKVYGEVNSESDIFACYISSKNNYRPIIVITTIKSFFIERYAHLYDRIDYEKLLIVDEAHNFINCANNELASKYVYKLGLSATPVFGNDEAKTKYLLEWFGGKVMDFPIEKAIGTYLVNYEYHPIFVNATEDDEQKFSKATTLMMSGIDFKRGIITDEKKYTLGYRGRLRAISMAEEKIEYIENIFKKVKDKDHTIIYCSDGKLNFENDENQEIRHLEHILQLINNALILDKSNLKASRFTATEDVETRMNLINCFNNGLINYLVAIKCLDEGINIPSIKSALILSSNDNYREFVQRRGRILRLYKDKDIANIYDVIVLPSLDNKSFVTVELRRFNEYARLAKNKDDLMPVLNNYLVQYGLNIDDIKFNNEYVYGGDLDD